MRQKKFLDPSSSTYSFVRAEIKGLTPGKKYALTVKVASTIRVKNGESTQYAPGIFVQIPGNIENPGYDHSIIDLTGKEAEWVSKTITFVAQGTETKVNFCTYSDAQYASSHDKFFNYGHVYVPQNAVVEVQ